MAQQQAQQAQQSPAALNMAARNLITTSAIKKTQEIYNETFDPASKTTLNINPRNAGLILGFFVEVNASVTNGATNAAAATQFGPSNMLSNISFFDLSNNVRINTAGWHMGMLNTAKNRAPAFGAQTLTAYPIDYGRNFTDLVSAPDLAADASDTVNMLYWVPLAYSALDLRGAVYANVVNATMNLQLTFNNSGFFVATGADPSSAVYIGNANGTVNSVQCRVHQVYYDQLPVSQKTNQPVLPVLDLSTVYEIKNTTLTGLSANSDFPLPYANFRDFLSTCVVYNNGGSLNDGTDIDYFAMQTANFTNTFKVPPKIVKAWERQAIRDDFPSGSYYFETRDRPISTIQFGNMELILNANTVNGGAEVRVGWESFAVLNNIGDASSLSAG